MSAISKSNGVHKSEFQNTNHKQCLQNIQEAMKASDEVSQLLQAERDSRCHASLCCCFKRLEEVEKSTRQIHPPLSSKMIVQIDRKELLQMVEWIKNNRAEILQQIEIRTCQKMRNFIVIITIIAVAIAWKMISSSTDPNAFDTAFKIVCFPAIVVAAISMAFTEAPALALDGVKTLENVGRFSTFDGNGKRTIEKWLELYIQNCDKAPPTIAIMPPVTNVTTLIDKKHD